MLAGMSDSAMIRLRDDAELWTAVSGTGPPVALLHGGPGMWDYLAPLAALLDSEFTVIRFDQRGCGRSTGCDGPFTIAQAVDDMDQVRSALGFARWAVVGHSWGAELALRYAAQRPDRVTAVAYVGGVGAGNSFGEAYKAERARRLGADRDRWAALSAIPDSDRSPAEERERCLLQWRTDFSPGPDAAGHALALWDTRPPGTVINTAAHQDLWADRETEDLLLAAVRVTCPVTMIAGSDDPRPWTATDSLLAALPHARRTVLSDAGHAPWAERPEDTRSILIDALRPAVPPDRGTPESLRPKELLPVPIRDAGVLNGLDEIPWAELSHAYGPAEDVPGLLRVIASGDPDAVKIAVQDLHGNIWHQGTVYEATAHAVPFLARMAAVNAASTDLLYLLGFIAQSTDDAHLAVPGSARAAVEPRRRAFSFPCCGRRMARSAGRSHGRWLSPGPRKRCSQHCARSGRPKRFLRYARRC